MFLLISAPILLTERPYSSNREFKQRGRRRLQKRRLKSDLALLQTLSRLFQLF